MTKVTDKQQAKWDYENKKQDLAHNIFDAIGAYREHTGEPEILKLDFFDPKDEKYGVVLIKITKFAGK